MLGGSPLAAAQAALAEGRWADARAGYEQALSESESSEACLGLAMAMWWQGHNHECVEWANRAYARFRQEGDVAGAARCAVWLAITYKANFGNFAAANGWIRRAERLLAAEEPGPLHGWLYVARAYRSGDLAAAEDLTERAVGLARAASDVDLELVALSQLGLIKVGQGDTVAGFALIDEAMAASLAGERTTLDTVVYTCCDMLSACELASDLERATQWSKVADDFVATYGCPFLYAECRIYHGSVLAARGRWGDAEGELLAGVRITAGTCPALHARALVRLAGLRIRQGRLEEADQFLAQAGEGVEAEAEEALSVAALLLARGDAPGACGTLERRLHQLEDHHAHLATALDVLVDAHLAIGDAEAAEGAAARLSGLAAASHAPRHDALAVTARGRVSSARGDPASATGHLEAALRAWSRLELPFELARTRFDLARVLADDQPEVAVSHARHALAGFDELGAALDGDRVAAFLRSLGVAARTKPPRTGTLTRREQEVLGLLGAGLSNPEIAARLHVSRKTASHHVSSILAKLHLRNRAEAAAYAVSGGGPPPEAP